MDLLNRSASVALPSHSSLTSLVSFPLPPLDRRALLSIQTRPVLSAWTWPSPSTLSVVATRSSRESAIALRSAAMTVGPTTALLSHRTVLSSLSWA